MFVCLWVLEECLKMPFSRSIFLDDTTIIMFQVYPSKAITLHMKLFY